MAPARIAAMQIAERAWNELERGGDGEGMHSVDEVAKLSQRCLCMPFQYPKVKRDRIILGVLTSYEFEDEDGQIQKFEWLRCFSQIL